MSHNPHESRLLPLVVIALFCLAFIGRAQAQLTYRYAENKDYYYEVRESRQTPNEVTGLSGCLILRVQTVDRAQKLTTLLVDGNCEMVKLDRNAKVPVLDAPKRLALPMLTSQSRPATVTLDSLARSLRYSIPRDSDRGIDMRPFGYLMHAALPNWNENNYRNITDDAFQSPIRNGDLAAKVVSTYTLGPRKDAIQTITLQMEAETVEKSNQDPLVKLTLNGTFEFDTQLGMIRSAQNTSTVSYVLHQGKAQITKQLQMRLLSPAELESIRNPPVTIVENPKPPPSASPESRMLAWKSSNKSFASDAPNLQTVASIAPAGVDRKIAPRVIPVPVKQIPPIGLSQGKDYELRDANQRQVLGIRVENAEEFRDPILRTIEPLYEKPAALGPNVTFARDGYVITSVFIQSANQVSGIRVMYTKLVDGKLDPSLSYGSPWLGTNSNSGNITRIDIKGQTLMGLYGTRRATINSVGLLLADESFRNKPTAFEPDLQTFWQPVASDARVTDALPQMVTNGSLTSDKTLQLARSQVLATAGPITSPVSFRMVLLATRHPLHMSYAADEIVFNDADNSDMLRVNGGPGNDQNRPGAGRLPLEAWCAVEWVINPDAMIIYVNGQERHRVAGDFSNIERQFAMRSNLGNIQIKSFDIVK